MPRWTGLYLLLAACGGGGGFPDAPLADQPGPTGKFSVSWSVVDQNNDPIACDRIGAQTVTTAAHNLAYEGGTPETFSCSTGMGTSQGLIPGTYEMDFQLYGIVGELARGEKQRPVSIDGNETTTLEPVTFQVEALGGVELEVSAGNAMGNCAAGAGIEKMSITLQHKSDGVCEPITLTISDGATQTGGTYTIDCTTPVERDCIDSDQTLSASGIPSDSYSITVQGKVAGTTCWLNGDTIQVPPLNKTLTRTLNLAQQTQTPGC